MSSDLWKPIFGNHDIVYSVRLLLAKEIKRRYPGNSDEYIERLINNKIFHLYMDAGWRERDILWHATNYEIVETPESMLAVRFYFDSDFAPYYLCDDKGMHPLSTSAEYLFFDDNGNARWVG